MQDTYYREGINIMTIEQETQYIREKYSDITNRLIDVPNRLDYISENISKHHRWMVSRLRHVVLLVHRLPGEEYPQELVDFLDYVSLTRIYTQLHHISSEDNIDRVGGIIDSWNDKRCPEHCELLIINCPKINSDVYAIPHVYKYAMGHNFKTSTCRYSCNMLELNRRNQISSKELLILSDKSNISASDIFDINQNSKVKFIDQFKLCTLIPSKESLTT